MSLLVNLLHAFPINANCHSSSLFEYDAVAVGRILTMKLLSCLLPLSNSRVNSVKTKKA